MTVSPERPFSPGTGAADGPGASGPALANDRSRRHTFFEDGVTVGFLTDPTLCIGCKACEVACKEWNDVPADGPSDGDIFGRRGYDHSGELGASTWRHVQFVETETDDGLPRWMFHSDVCRHCEHAGCLEACPTGAIRRTEVGSVLVEDDICNGCGYCVVSCPFGVVDRRGGLPSGVGTGRGERSGRGGRAERGERSEGGRGTGATANALRARTDRPGYGGAAGATERTAEPAPRTRVRGLPGEGGAFKCTFCVDRQVEGRLPACAHACPTDSILFGALDDLRGAADRRLAVLLERGIVDASLYDAAHTNVGGTHALSILVGDEPEGVASLWGLPRDPVVPTAYLREAWTSAFVTVALAAALCLLAFLLGGPA